MNKYFTMVAIGLLTAMGTQAETVWTRGVSLDGGWYDANKTTEDDGVEIWGGIMEYPKDETGEGAKTDDNMCYAASAANLLAWWQAQYKKEDGVPQGVDTIWSTLVENSTKDAGGNMPAAIKWWLTGKDDDSFTYLADKTSGYYSEYTEGITLYDKQNGGTFIESIANPTGQQLINALNNGKGVSLRANDHAITLWGLEHENGIITKMWITDSDDYTMTPEMIELVVNGSDGAYSFVLDNKQFTINTAYTIDPSVSDSWGMQRVGENIPEPTSATLSLMAMAAFALRRRRH